MDKKAYILKRSEELRACGSSVEEILRYYRSSGLSILESMQLITQLMQLSLPEAKQLVHFSETWADLRPAHDRFHRNVDEVVGSFDEKKNE